MSSGSASSSNLASSTSQTTEGTTTGPERDPLPIEWHTIISNTLAHIYAVQVATRMRKEMPAFAAKIFNDLCKDTESLMATVCRDSLQADLAKVREAYEREVAARKQAEEELHCLRTVVDGCTVCSTAADASTSNK
jgi:hypothetical protein